MLDEALAHDLKVFVDVPWEKHRCFFEDWDAQQQARQRVRQTARQLGNHPAVFAISVVNEIPVDVVRFYGSRMVEKFVDELMEIVKQEAPSCLTTFVNFPTTEFLRPAGGDFCCFNVYVHNEKKLGAYLDRLQHVAGDKPLLLGEYGIDTLREGDIEQAKLLSEHVRRVFRHGAAGSFIFSYTDDWFTGGHQIEDWAFGVTDRQRTEKSAAVALREVWKEEIPLRPQTDLPKVSVIVCSYNGGQTLRECLASLMRLDYPDVEIVLVDDGSTDQTPAIAAEFPEVIYHRQVNKGLSEARNVGAELATGEIVAYTDSDCVVDEHWLRYLVQSMRDQNVEAIGGPNITPPSDGWIAKCVAASPGNPSHVMLDDHFAEHIPGCNMAFRRQTLLDLGGFDTQFRQAGDDVDLCWRLLDTGQKIGYAPAAMVWHHRRATVKAYAKQQKGYGRAEAMVQFKHPHRFGVLGRSSWQGIIYGDGAIGLPLTPARIYHGRFGSGLFQTIYRHNQINAWACTLSLEWHLAAIFCLLLATMFWPLALVSVAMWTASLVLATRLSLQAPLPQNAPFWCRPLTLYLYILQPILRGWYRMTHLLGRLEIPRHRRQSRAMTLSKRISAIRRDIYWQSNDHVGREALLARLVEIAKADGWNGDFDNAWADWDVKLLGDRWHFVTVRTATEELGWPKRFTRARCTARQTRFCRVALATSAVWTATALMTFQSWGIAVGLILLMGVLFCIQRSRHRCLAAATELLACSGWECGLKPVDVGVTELPPTHDVVESTPALTRQKQDREFWVSVAGNGQFELEVAIDDSNAVAG
jgi:GT2 family glycosyltransferase